MTSCFKGRGDSRLVSIETIATLWRFPIGFRNGMLQLKGSCAIGPCLAPPEPRLAPFVGEGGTPSTSTTKKGHHLPKRDILLPLGFNSCFAPALASPGMWAPLTAIGGGGLSNVAELPKRGMSLSPHKSTGGRFGCKIGLKRGPFCVEGNLVIMFSHILGKQKGLSIVYSIVVTGSHCGNQKVVASICCL